MSKIFVDLNIKDKISQWQHGYQSYKDLLLFCYGYYIFFFILFENWKANIFNLFFEWEAVM